MDSDPNQLSNGWISCSVPSTTLHGLKLRSVLGSLLTSLTSDPRHRVELISHTKSLLHEELNYTFQCNLHLISCTVVSYLFYVMLSFHYETGQCRDSMPGIGAKPAGPWRCQTWKWAILRGAYNQLVAFLEGKLPNPDEVKWDMVIRAHTVMRDPDWNATWKIPWWTSKQGRGHL